MATAEDLIPIEDDPVGALLVKLRRRDEVSEAEAHVLSSAVDRIEEVPANKVLVTEGQPLTFSILLLEGFVGRFKDLSDGQRQITELHVAGDFVDLHGFLLKHLEHAIGTLTAVRIAIFPHEALKRITEQQPHLARMLWLSSLIDAAIQRERILSLGRRTALAAVAHLICELHCRLEVVGLTDGHSFRFPATQIDIADATGLTPVHVNRMLRKLRTDGLMTFRSGVVDIHDLPALEELAEFDNSYLFLKPEPR